MRVLNDQAMSQSTWEDVDDNRWQGPKSGDSRVQWTAILYILGKMLLLSHVRLSADLLIPGVVAGRSIKYVCKDIVHKSMNRRFIGGNTGNLKSNFHSMGYGQDTTPTSSMWFRCAERWKKECTIGVGSSLFGKHQQLELTRRQRINKFIDSVFAFT